MLDNYDMFCQHEAEMEIRISKMPKCAECGEAIQDDICYEINDEYICEGCLHENHRKWVEDVV